MLYHDGGFQALIRYFETLPFSMQFSILCGSCVQMALKSHCCVIALHSVSPLHIECRYIDTLEKSYSLSFLVFLIFTGDINISSSTSGVQEQRVFAPVEAEQGDGDAETWVPHHLNQPGQTLGSQAAHQRTAALQGR